MEYIDSNNIQQDMNDKNKKTSKMLEEEKNIQDDDSFVLTQEDIDQMLLKEAMEDIDSDNIQEDTNDEIICLKQ